MEPNGTCRTVRITTSGRGITADCRMFSALAGGLWLKRRRNWIGHCWKQSAGPVDFACSTFVWLRWTVPRLWTGWPPGSLNDYDTKKSTLAAWTQAKSNVVLQDLCAIEKQQNQSLPTETSRPNKEVALG